MKKVFSNYFIYKQKKSYIIMYKLLSYCCQLKEIVMHRIIMAVICVQMSASLAMASERYVSLSGGHVSPYASWETAATNIQSAISACVSGDVVWVTNGVYDTGEFVNTYPDDGIKSRVAITNPVTVRS
ncbi:MAG: hypothetical protein WC299_09705, partial [Kiritimatiellia bacterium]